MRRSKQNIELNLLGLHAEPEGDPLHLPPRSDTSDRYTYSCVGFVFFFLERKTPLISGNQERQLERKCNPVGLRMAPKATVRRRRRKKCDNREAPPSS